MALFDGETPMTPDDWEALRELARAHALKLEDRGYPSATVTRFDELADKCLARRDALREGRVVP